MKRVVFLAATVFLFVAMGLDLYAAEMTWQERRKSIEYEVTRSLFLLGEERQLFPTLTHLYESAYVVYLGQSGGKATFSVTILHEILDPVDPNTRKLIKLTRTGKYWTHTFVIPLKKGGKLTLLYGYSLVLNSFNDKEAEFGIEFLK